MHRPFYPRGSRRSLAQAVGTLSLVYVLSVPVAQAQPRHFDISAQPLANALNLLAAQSGLQVIFDGDLVQGKNSPTVQGDREPEQALTELLQGSGLSWRSTGEGTVTLERLVDTHGALELGALTILGQGMGEMTENSGAYTTGAVSVGSKSPTSLRYTPQSVSVITRQMIEDTAANELEDALRYAPGVTVNKTGSSNYDYYSRGFNIDSIQIDGAAPMALTSNASSFYSQRLYNLVEFDHVEVLRGAGALFSGVGDPGGVINVVRKRALPTYQLKLEAAAGSWDTYRSMLDVTGPLNDSGSLRGRLVTAYTDRKYFVDDMSTEKPTVYGVLEWDLTPSDTFTLGGMYEKIHARNYAGLPRYSDGRDIGLPRHTSLSQKWAYSDTVSQEIFTKWDHYFDNGWKANLTYTNTHDAGEALSAVTTRALDPVTLTGPIGRGSINRFWTNQNLFDTNLSGSFEAYGREHEFVIGGDWQHVTSKWKGAGALSNTNQPVDVFDPQPWDPNPITKTYPRVYSPNTQVQYGLYGRLSLQVADPLKVILGGRVSRYHFEQVYKSSGVVQSNVDMREPTRLVPYGGVIYDLTDNWSAYGSYSEIYKPQQNKLVGPVGSGSVVDPMVGKTYEAGLKGEHFDGRLSSGIALFYTKRKGGAIEDPNYPRDDVLWGGSCCYLSQGEVISKGIELQASGELSPGWNLMASYVFNLNRNRTEGGGLSTITPKHEGKLWTTYQLPGNWHDWTLGGGVTVQSATYVTGSALTYDAAGNSTGTNTDYAYSQAGYTLYDAMARYRVNQHWDVTFNGNNLFDKHYYRTVSSSANGNYYGEPRNFSVTLRGQY
ncbi:TonB-dependent siderophore receptor [Pseudomonas sp. NPDC089401]|uniref:TonB-dependent siderophore receptor n=1 Tax=Pseudomonas sp. NPDC089401 TaxID=3364462 RepID=UPI0037F8C7A2